MSPTDRIATGVAKHFFECRPSTADTCELIEEALRRGYELGRSVRLPISDNSAESRARRPIKDGELFYFRSENDSYLRIGTSIGLENNHPFAPGSRWA
jgi:hypothetical protein